MFLSGTTGPLLKIWLAFTLQDSDLLYKKGEECCVYRGLSNNNKIHQTDSCIQSCLRFFRDQYSLKDRSTFCAWHGIDGMSCTQKDKSFAVLFFSFPGRGRTKAKQKTRNSHHFHRQVPRKRMEREHKHMSVKCGSGEERGKMREEMRWEERGERSEAGGDKCLDSGFRDNSHNGRHL